MINLIRRTLIAVPRGGVGRNHGARNRHRDNKIDGHDNRCVRVDFGRHVNDLVAAALACH